jgi:mgtE-like transporter
LLESLPIFIILAIIAFIGGTMLSILSSAFEAIPGLIITIPALIDLRGNINGALGSRLGSAVHLGVVDLKNIFNIEVKENIKASIVLSIIFSLSTGCFATLTSIIFMVNIEPLKVVVITFIGGTLSGVILTFTTLLIVIIAVKKKVDPDNVTSPLLATIGDVFTIFCVFSVVVVTLSFW